jgi:hypothetical protein
MAIRSTHACRSGISAATIQQVDEVAKKALTLAELHTEIKNNSYWKNITV